MVEFENQEDARRAFAELKRAGFTDQELRLVHPFEGGAIVEVVAWGAELLTAFEVLRRYEAGISEQEEPRDTPAL